MDKPPVREMIRQAAEALGEQFSNAEICEFVLERWPDINKGTIQCQITISTVNQQSRVSYPENQRPRVAHDRRYDFLYRVGQGRRVLYDAEIHGIWRIAEMPDGDLVVVCDDDDEPVPDLPPEVPPQPSTPSQMPHPPIRYGVLQSAGLHLNAGAKKCRQLLARLLTVVRRTDPDR
jgi:hypothetical protein